MPRIVITRKVKIALLVLRVYLATMLVLIVIGFVRRATHKDEPPKQDANAARASGPAPTSVPASVSGPATASAPASAPTPAPASAEAEPPR